LIGVATSPCYEIVPTRDGLVADSSLFCDN
jgi:hypothetical protein